MIEDFKNSACPEFEALLEDHLSGELGGADAAKLSAHLRSCAGCRAALDFAAPTGRFFAAVDPTPDPGPGFARQVMARIRVEQARAVERSIWRPFISVAWRFAAGAALAVVALVSYDAAFNSRRNSDMAVLNLPQSPDLITDAGAPPNTRDEILLMMAETNHGKH
jgi:anti-sigma factor RsiW